MLRKGLIRIQEVNYLENIGNKFGVEKLEEIISNEKYISKFINNYNLYTPNFLLWFIKEITSINNKKNTIFDPWLNLHSPSLFFDSEKIKGICFNADEYKAINDILSIPSINAISGNPLEEIDKVKDKHDFVISFPPFGMKTDKETSKKYHKDMAATLLLKSEQLLSIHGQMIFLLTNSILSDDNFKKLLKEAGLFINAIFYLPSGTFNPITSIPTNLVLASRNNSEKTFLAEIHDDGGGEYLQKIIENYKSKKEGKIFELGNYIDIDDYKSYTSILAERDYNTLAKNYGELYILDWIVKSINLLKTDNIEEIEHLSNSIYLPILGNSPVVINVSDMKIKPHNYYQIQIDEKKGDANFIANYFNTDIGKKLRVCMESGSTIPQISKISLLNQGLYLPDIETQIKTIEVDSKIEQINLSLADLKRNLWKYPKSYSKVKKELKSINRDDKLENWIDKLPFPISSILWRYYATKDNAKRIEHLFHFFEAFSEFFSMLILSALVQNKDFYKEECNKWIDKDEKFQNWYLRASFGNWNHLSLKLSKAIRGYFSDPDKKDFCMNLFGNPSEAFVSMITNKRIINTLQEVGELRNKWKGHAGISGEEENHRRVITLEQHLNGLRRNIADAFDETKMFSPMNSRMENGIYTFKVKELIGARTPFNEEIIKTTNSLDSKKLYLRHSNQIKPLELLPFIKFVETENAFYFYTSIESKNARWVSYHFEKEAELKQPVSDELFKAFDFLKL